MFQKSRLQKDESDAVGALCHAIFPLPHPLTFTSPPVGERSVTRTGQSLRGTATGRTFGGAAAPVMEEPGLQWRRR